MVLLVQVKLRVLKHSGKLSEDKYWSSIVMKV